jgi:hypothetical protein
MLLLNEKNAPELVPCDQVMNVANESREVRAFTFKRNNDFYAVYWHISGDKQLELPVNSADITLMENIGQEIQVKPGSTGNSTLLPAGDRRYIKTNKLTKEELITAFRNAKITD